MNISEKGTDLIKKFEGLRLDVYKDVVGLPTVGYGHLIKDGEDFGVAISQEQADNILDDDLKTTVKCVNALVRYPLTQQEFDAVVCLTFNIGCRALQSSTLLKLINTGDIEGAAEQFLRWDFAKKKKIQGLTNRRIAERHLFLDLA